jgi:hypothetical protein
MRTRASQSRRPAAKIAKSSQNIVPLRTVNILPMNTTTRLMSSTVSEYESSSMRPSTDSLDRGLVISKGQFVFVKNDSTEDWIARVERVCGKKRKLYVRWMREDGQEIVMDDEFAWLSVDTIQDLAQLRPQVHPPNIEERWMYKVPTKPAPLSPPGDEHTPLQTVPTEHGKSKTTETIFRLTSSQNCDVARTAWYPLGDSERNIYPVSEMTTKTKSAPVQLGSSRRWNLPPLWEVLGDYRHHRLW